MCIRCIYKYICDFMRPVASTTSNVESMTEVLTAFGKWDSNSAEWLKHNSTSEWLKFHNYLLYSYGTTCYTSSKHMTRFLLLIYNILKAKWCLQNDFWIQNYNNLILPVHSKCWYMIRKLYTNLGTIFKTTGRNLGQNKWKYLQKCGTRHQCLYCFSSFPLEKSDIKLLQGHVSNPLA